VGKRVWFAVFLGKTTGGDAEATGSRKTHRRQDRRRYRTAENSDRERLILRSLETTPLRSWL
jgi:hypothetical protein